MHPRRREKSGDDGHSDHTREGGEEHELTSAYSVDDEGSGESADEGGNTE